MPRATCPTSPEHATFTATAHVTQTWVMDQNGGFIKALTEADETTHSPDADDVWHCQECGEAATVVN